MKSILSFISVFVFCVLCSSLQIYASSFGLYDDFMVVVNDDTYNRNIGTIKIMMDNPEGPLLLLSLQHPLFYTGMGSVTFPLLSIFNGANSTFCFPAMDIPPPALDIA
jgi:hypothetical protein